MPHTTPATHFLPFRPLRAVGSFKSGERRQGLQRSGSLRLECRQAQPAALWRHADKDGLRRRAPVEPGTTQDERSSPLTNTRGNFSTKSSSRCHAMMSLRPDANLLNVCLLSTRNSCSWPTALPFSTSATATSIWRTVPPKRPSASSFKVSYVYY